MMEAWHRARAEVSTVDTIHMRKFMLTPGEGLASWREEKFWTCIYVAGLLGLHASLRAVSLFHFSLVEGGDLL